MLLCDFENMNNATTALATADMFISDVGRFIEKTMSRVDGHAAQVELKTKLGAMYIQLELSNTHKIVKDATLACTNNESTSCRLMYQGTSTSVYTDNQSMHVPGAGHHGNDYAGVAAVCNGKQLAASAAPAGFPLIMTQNRSPRTQWARPMPNPRSNVDTARPPHHPVYWNALFIINLLSSQNGVSRCSVTHPACLSERIYPLACTLAELRESVCPASKESVSLDSIKIQVIVRNWIELTY